MLYGLIQLFLQPGLGTVSLNKCSPVISVWWEGGAGHIRVSRMGGVGLRDEPGYDLLLTVITNLNAENGNSVSLPLIQYYDNISANYDTPESVKSCSSFCSSSCTPLSSIMFTLSPL